ncbi:MAG: hypothetical protein WDN31_13050 [Hyphomicrobium sp.]
MLARAHRHGRRRTLAASVALLCLVAVAPALAQAPAPGKKAGGPSEAAAQIADIFSQIGDQLYDECIFELSPEQVEVQHALIQAYIAQGATSAMARQLAVKQIQPPKLSDKCEAVRRQPPAAPAPWETTLQTEQKPKLKAPPKLAAEPALPETPASPTALATLAGMTMLPQWDCGTNVDYVTISLNGFKRKLTGGEICNPFEDVVHEVPASLPEFRLGYAITTGRLFVVSDDQRYAGRTIAWALSGRDVCRNNPDPVCFAARRSARCRRANTRSPPKRICASAGARRRSATLPASGCASCGTRSGSRHNRGRRSWRAATSPFTCASKAKCRRRASAWSRRDGRTSRRSSRKGARPASTRISTTPTRRSPASRRSSRAPRSR